MADYKDVRIIYNLYYKHKTAIVRIEVDQEKKAIIGQGVRQACALSPWRGSIYKLVWKELIIYLVAYYIINFIYRFALDDSSRRYFIKLTEYCEKYHDLIPLSFILGFYLNIIMNRWWSQFQSIPYPDNLALLVSSSIHSKDNRSRLVRRTLMRYVCLAFVMTLTLISPKVKKRFPTLNHLVAAGLLQNDEMKIFNDINDEYPNYSKQWMPLVWAGNVVTLAKLDGLIKDDFSVKALLTELCNFRAKCGTLLDYDWISVPLVYTQVVTLAVYSYFVTTLFAFQMLENDNNKTLDLYFPVLAVLEFFFYMGWLKVAEVLINPFGDDDDDFDVSWMVDRNIQVTYLIVDKMHREHPELIRDRYWSNMAPQTLPHTLASGEFAQDIPVHSTTNINVKLKEQDVYQPEVESLDTVDGGCRKRNTCWPQFCISSKHHKAAELREVGTNFDLTETVGNVNMDAVDSEEVNETREGNSDMEAFEKLKAERQMIKEERLKSLIDRWTRNAQN